MMNDEFLQVIKSILVSVKKIVKDYNNGIMIENTDYVTYFNGQLMISDNFSTCCVIQLEKKKRDLTNTIRFNNNSITIDKYNNSNIYLLNTIDVFGQNKIIVGNNGYLEDSIMINEKHIQLYNIYNIFNDLDIEHRCGLWINTKRINIVECVLMEILE